MKMKMVVFLAAFALTSAPAWAGSTTLKQIDAVQNSAGGAAISVPGVGSSFLSDSNTATVTGKTMSGASNTFSAIPVGAIGNGSVLSGSNTGDVTIGTANGLSLLGQALSLDVSSGSTTGALTSTDWTTFNGKLGSSLTSAHLFVGSAGGVATDTAITGDVTIDNSGVTAIGANKVTAAKMSSGAATAGQVATADGAGNVSYQNASVMPSVNNSQASPQSVVAGTGISISSPTYENVVFVAGNAGAVTVTATPSISACTAAGQKLAIFSEDATNTVTLQDEANLAGSKLYLNGNWTGGLNQMLSLMCDGNGFWVEQSRSN